MERLARSGDLEAALPHYSVLEEALAALLEEIQKLGDLEAH